MTNKEKFMEVINQVFNASYTEDNMDVSMGCPVVFEYKKHCPNNCIPCCECREWWDKEYKED